jgi:hypothetical protein
VTALMTGKVVHIAGASNKMTVLAPHVFPRVVIRRVVRAAQERRR